jgi:hypothetical protein
VNSENLSNIEKIYCKPNGSKREVENQIGISEFRDGIAGN